APPALTPTPGDMGTPSGSTQSPVPPAVPTQDVPFLPNPAWQPGANNPDVTQDNIQTTICVSGYSSKIRPPVSYTDKLKKKQIVQYGYTDTNLADYEEDHLVSLEIGGHPTDPQNLWPQPRHTQPWNASIKDTVENVLHGMICSGQLPLDTARQAIATDWVAAYQKYVPHSLFALTPVPPEP
ncbi:MAG TPA: hypothetical protein VMJ64_05645, partial [Anaerolineales bacterium]|nr:hypothetical protein [Anaerolineales bacterium]